MALGGERPQVPLRAQAGTRVEPLTFCKLAGYLPHMKEKKVPDGVRINGEDKSTI